MMIREKWKETSSLSLVEAAFLMLGIDPADHEDDAYFKPEYLEHFNNHQMGERVAEKVRTLLGVVKDKLIELAPTSSPTEEIADARSIRILSSSYVKWLSDKAEYRELVAAFLYPDTALTRVMLPEAALAEPNNYTGVAEKSASVIEATPTQPWTEPGLKRRQQQMLIIESLVDEFKYERLSIPDGGKATIGTKCKSCYSKWFGAGDDPFLEAWQEAVTQGRIRMTKHHQYSGK